MWCHEIKKIKMVMERLRMFKDRERDLLSHWVFLIRLKNQSIDLFGIITMQMSVESMDRKKIKISDYRQMSSDRKK